MRNYKNNILENINYFHGPCFGCGTDLGTSGDVSKIFGWTWIGAAFKDVLNMGASIFTGDSDKNNIYIRIQEIEVFQIFKQ